MDQRDRSSPSFVSTSCFSPASVQIPSISSLHGNEYWVLHIIDKASNLQIFTLYLILLRLHSDLNKNGVLSDHSKGMCTYLPDTVHESIAVDTSRVSSTTLMSQKMIRPDKSTEYYCTNTKLPYQVKCLPILPQQRVQAYQDLQPDNRSSTCFQAHCL